MDNDDLNEVEGVQQLGTGDEEYVKVQGLEDTKEFLDEYYGALGEDTNRAMEYFTVDRELVLVDGLEKYAATTLQEVENLVSLFKSKAFYIHSFQKIDEMLLVVGFVLNYSKPSRLFVNSFELRVDEGRDRINKSIFYFVDNIEDLPIVTLLGPMKFDLDYLQKKMDTSTAFVPSDPSMQ